MTSNLRREGRHFDIRRFFCDDDDLFHFGEKTYALSNQWGVRSATEGVEAILARYGDQDISYRPSPEENV